MQATPSQVPPKKSLGSLLAGMFAPKQKALAAPAEAPKKAAPRKAAVGGTGTPLYAGFLTDIDQNAELRGSKWYGEPGLIGVAGKMMRDGHVRRSFAALTKPIRAATWDVKPASDSDLDVEIADFVRWNLFESCIKWDDVLRGAQYHLRDGFSLLEVTDDVVGVSQDRFPNHPGKGKGIAITGFHQRPASTVHRWLQSKTNTSQIDGVEQYLQGSENEEHGLVTIPADRLLRFTYEQEGAAFAGFSALRSAYGAWKTKLTFLVLDAIRNEKMAVGTPCLKLPEEAGEEEIAQAQTILAEMRSHEKGYLILPFGFEFSWESASVADQAAAIATCIERCNRDIAFNVGAGFMLLGLSGDTGSFALATTQQGQYQIELDTEAKFLVDVLNVGSDGWSPITRLVQLNYGMDAAIPRVVVRNMPTRDWSKILPVVHNMTTSGGVWIDAPLRAHIREVLGLPPEDPKTIVPFRSASPTQPPAANQDAAAADDANPDDAKQKEAA